MPLEADEVGSRPRFTGLDDIMRSTYGSMSKLWNDPGNDIRDRRTAACYLTIEEVASADRTIGI